MPRRPEVICHNCGGAYNRDECTHCEECDTYNCATCGPCADSSSRRDRAYAAGNYGIHAWNYRPRHFKPKGNYPAEALLGVELEVGGRRGQIIAETTRTVDADETHLYLKEDGSISGAEIVTHPMTLQFARQYPFEELLASLRRVRCRVDDHYGLHVHVSRNAFIHDGKQSKSHQMLWLLFMYRHARELELLARRTSERYAAFRKPVSGELKRKATDVGDRYNDSRYVAVNCNNERTFELRFFKATLKYPEFMAALEFADASVRYTENMTTADVLRRNALTWRHFTDWVQRRNYKHLYTEIMRLAPPQLLTGKKEPLNRWSPPEPRPRRRRSDEIRFNLAGNYYYIVDGNGERERLTAAGATNWVTLG